MSRSREFRRCGSLDYRGYRTAWSIGSWATI